MRTAFYFEIKKFSEDGYCDGCMTTFVSKVTFGEVNVSVFYVVIFESRKIIKVSK